MRIQSFGRHINDRHSTGFKRSRRRLSGAHPSNHRRSRRSALAFEQLENRRLLAVDLVTNGSFETGTLSGWSTSGLGTTGTCAMAPRDFNVSNSASSTGCSVVANPANGTYAAYNMMDGPAGTQYKLFQSISVPTGLTSALLSWKDSDLSFYSGNARTFSVDLFNSSGTTLLGNAFTRSVPNSDGDSAWVPHSVDVTSILQPWVGSSAQLRFTVSIPQTWTGPAGLGVDSISILASVNNPPVASANGPYTVIEGGTVTLNGSGSDPDGNPISFEWDLDGDAVFGEVAGDRGNETLQNPTFSAVGLDGPSAITVGLRTRDSLAAVSPIATATINITNVAPTLTISGATSVNEGSVYTLGLAASDPGADTISGWAINWGDGSAPESVAGNATSVQHTFADGTRNFTILATATDEDGTYTARAAGANAQASLDPSFGNAGEIVQNFDGFTADYIRTLTVLQPDGKVLVAGYIQGGTTRVALARYNTDGSLDQSFGTGGTVITEFGTYAYAESLVFDNNGNVLVAGSFGIARYSANGVLDTGFGNGGRITSFQNIRKAVRDGNGNILVGDGSRFARFQPTGAFDLSFGQNGITPYLGNSYSDFALAPDGKIVTIESRYNGNQTNQYDIVVRRYLSNGQADPGFGQSGLYAFDNGGFADYATTVVIQQGKVLVGGYSQHLQPHPTIPNSYQTVTRSVLLFRLADDGQGLDGSFGSSGKVLFRYNAVNGNNYDYFYGMGVDPTDRIVVSGSYGQYRFSVSGQLDTGFGMSGVASRIIYPYSGGGIAFGSQGLIYLGGYYSSGSQGSNFAVQRFLDNGTPDNSFDSDSYVQTSFSGPLADYLRHVAVRQADGKIVVVGYTSGGVNEMLMARYLPDGQLDSGFGNGGIVRTGVNGSVNAAAVANDGTIFVSNGSYIWRYLPNGSLDTTTPANGFGTSGQRYAEGVYIQSLQIDTSGRLLASGYRWQPTNGYYSYDFAVVRFSQAGVLDSGYGTSGIASFDLNTTATIRSDQIPYGMDVDGSGRVTVVGYTNDYNSTTSQSTNNLAVIARFTSTGQLDPTFNPSGGGILLTTGGDGSTSARTVAMDPLGRIIVGFSYALHRYNPDGTLDTSFSGDGIALNNYYYIQALHLDGVGRIVMGGSGHLTRFNDDGTPDTAFGPNGRVSTSGRNSYAIAVDNANHVIAAGYKDSTGSTGTDYWLARYITDGLAVTVNNVAPQNLMISGPTSANEGSSITLTASATDPAGLNDPLTYSWNITRNSSAYLQISGASITFAVPDNGSYVATVTVDDGDGGVANQSRTIAVANVAPTATFSAPASVDEGSPLTLAISSPQDASSVDAAAGFVYAFDFGAGYGAFSVSNTASYIPADNGNRTVRGKIRDKDGGVTEYTAAVTVNNVAPQNVDAGSDQTVNEGDTVSLSGSFTDPGSADTHSQVWSVVASNGQLIGNGTGGSFSFVPNDNGTYTVTYTVTDDDSDSTSDTVVVTVNNVAPTATDNTYTTAQATALIGNVITDNAGSGVDSDPGGASDPLTVSAHTSPSNGTLVLHPDGSFTFTPDSTFAGADSFSYTISDGDGGFSTATVTINVTAAAPGSSLTINDSCLGGTALLITGTSGNDTIVVEPGSTAATLSVTFNGVSSTVAKPSGRIIVTGGDGDDNIQIAGAILNPVWLYGDRGNDRLNAGGGGSLLIGGDGSDQLLGGGGRDIMIGGEGADNLVGNSNDDILVAGYTTKDLRASVNHEEFWCDVLKEWKSSRSFAERVANLRPSLLPQVIDDVFADSIDFLNGSAGDDWLIFAAGEDRVAGKAEMSN